MGPEGGEAGGTIVAQGSPESFAREKFWSHTASFLVPFLEQRRR
jgi:excinuclease ABC subunit A